MRFNKKKPDPIGVPADSIDDAMLLDRIIAILREGGPQSCSIIGRNLGGVTHLTVLGVIKRNSLKFIQLADGRFKLRKEK